MKQNNASNGIGFTGFLALTFIVLRLTHFIDWPWIWVVAPIWIPLAISLLILLFVAVVEALRK